MKTENTKTEAAARQFIGIYTEDGLDGVAETRAQAEAEKRDLRAMGFTVNLYVASDESTLDAIGDWIRDGRSFAVARNRVESGHYAPETVERNAEAEAEAAARNARRAEAEAPAAEDAEALRAEAAAIQSRIVATCGHGRRARLAEQRDSLIARAEAAEAAQAAEAAAEDVAEAMAAEAQRAGGLIFPPAHMNGYPVTAIQDHKNGFFTVMAIRDAHNAPCHARLVVATWWHGLGESWAWGHYIDGHGDDSTAAQAEAESVFSEVALRNRRRTPVSHLLD